MNRFRSFVLPIAIVLGLLLHDYCAVVKGILPYLIFMILLSNYAAVEMCKLRPGRLDLWLMLIQVSGSILPYLLLRWAGVDPIICEGVMMVVLCPVAASVIVISCILGANRECVTTYTILGNLMVAVVAPAIFSFIGNQQDMRFIDAFLMILRRTALIIALPFFLALIGQKLTPHINKAVSRMKGFSFYLWALTLTITLGQTIDFIFLHGDGNWNSIFILGLASVLICAFQFAFGKWLGQRCCSDRMAGGQLLAQKNVAMGVWMANTFLTPLASVGIALYSIWQNLFNSWQMWVKEHRDSINAK